MKITELVVISYDDAETAEAARKKLFELCNEYYADIGDELVAVADEDCQIHLRQIVNPWSLGMLSASFWGLLVGLLFMNPLLGVFAGAAAGAFMKEVAADLSPGKAVLFMMARIINSDRVASHLVDFGGTVLPTNLSSTDEAKLRAHFKAARKA